jgi:hypothetical protein
LRCNRNLEPNSPVFVSFDDRGIALAGHVRHCRSNWRGYVVGIEVQGAPIRCADASLDVTFVSAWNRFRPLRTVRSAFPMLRGLHRFCSRTGARCGLSIQYPSTAKPYNSHYGRRTRGTVARAHEAAYFFMCGAWYRTSIARRSHRDVRRCRPRGVCPFSGPRS